MKDIEKKAPNFSKVIDHVMVKNMFQKKVMHRLLENADSSYVSFAEDVVNRMLKAVDRGEVHEYLATTYLWYTKTIRIEEMYFAKEGKYRFSNYDEVYEKVYGRDDYMFDYVVGLGMTQIFWPNHYAIIRFFLDQFVPMIEAFSVGAEIGVGHGIFHSELLRGAPLMKSTLLDVSPTALDMTRRMIAATGIDPARAEPVQVDVQKEIPLADESLDALLMGELVEHIQYGEELMSSIRKKMKPEGLCFFSTAANAPAEDHILLFRTTGEIRDFLNRTGWEVMKEHLGTINEMSVEDAEAGSHNINYAAVIKTK